MSIAVFRLRECRVLRALACLSLLLIFALPAGCGSGDKETASKDKSKYLPGSDDEAAAPETSNNDSGQTAGTSNGNELAGGSNASGAPATGNPPAGTGSSVPNGNRPSLPTGEVPIAGGGAPAQPPIMTGGSLEGDMYEAPQGSSNEIMGFIDRMRQMLARPDLPPEDEIKVQRALVDASDNLREAVDDPITQMVAIRLKADSLQRLFMLNEEGAREEFSAYCDSLLQDPNRQIASLGRLYLMGIVVMEFLTDENDDFERVKNEMTAVITEYNDQADVFMMAQGVIGQMFQTDHRDEGLVMLSIAADIFAQSPNPQVAEAGKEMLDQRDLANLGFDLLQQKMFEDDEAAAAELVEVCRKVLNNKRPSQYLYSQLNNSARIMEIKGFYTQSLQMFDMMGAACEGHPDATLAEIAAKFTSNAHRRVSLLNQPIEITGVDAAGEPFDWSAYRGKVVLVTFWHSEWIESLQAFAAYEQAFQKYADKGFAVIGINVDELRLRFDQFNSQVRLSWPSIVSADPNLRGLESPMAVNCGVDSPPFSFLVDQNGIVTRLHVYADLEEHLQAIFDSPESATDNAADNTESVDGNHSGAGG